MAITFSAADRKSITRRQIRIEQENAAFAQSSAAFTEQQTQLQQVDVGNAQFYDYYNVICQSYENELRQINGNVADVYSPSDLTLNAEFPNNLPFFPATSTPAYARNIPLIQDGSYTNNKVKGVFHPTSTDSRYEQNILTNASIPDGLTQMIFRLENGISGTSDATTTSTNAIPGGNITNHSVNVINTAGFLAGEYIYIRNTFASGLYKIVSITSGTVMVIDSIFGTISEFGFNAGANIKNTVAAFSASDRETLTSSLYQELLTRIVTGIAALITEWEPKVDIIVSSLTSNIDDRSPQISENSNALSIINATKSAIDTWQALSDTGVNGKYVAASIAPISSFVSTRLSDAATRISQITIALGASSGDALTQSGETYATNIPNNPYYNRYKWLSFRINRLSGSLRRYHAAGQSGGAVQQLAADNTSLKTEYNGYFLTKAVVFNDGTSIIHVKDLIGLSVGNTVSIVSETQPEITRTISALMGTTQLKLNAPVPNTYTLGDIARVFKTL